VRVCVCVCVCVCVHVLHVCMYVYVRVRVCVHVCAYLAQVDGAHKARADENDGIRRCGVKHNRPNLLPPLQQLRRQTLCVFAANGGKRASQAQSVTGT
jgi:hypothetical protein